MEFQENQMDNTKEYIEQYKNKLESLSQFIEKRNILTKLRNSWKLKKTMD